MYIKRGRGGTGSGRKKERERESKYGKGDMGRNGISGWGGGGSSL